jgi:hypothetical protein
MTTRTTWPLWQPPGETLETIAESRGRTLERRQGVLSGAVILAHRDELATRPGERYHFANGGKLIK